MRPQGLTTAKTVAKVSVVGDTAGKKSVARRSKRRSLAIAHDTRILLIPVLMIIRNCSLIRGSYTRCRIRTIMSNRGLPTGGVVTGEQ
jgi:hypothetical protein